MALGPPESPTFLERVTVLLSNVPGLGMGERLAEKEERWVHGTLVAPNLILTTARNLEQVRRSGEPIAWALGDVSLGPEPTPVGGPSQDEASGIVLVGLGSGERGEVPLERSRPLCLTSAPRSSFCAWSHQGAPRRSRGWPSSLASRLSTGGGDASSSTHRRSRHCRTAWRACRSSTTSGSSRIVSSDTTDRSTGERELLAVPMAEIMSGPLGATIRQEHARIIPGTEERRGPARESVAGGTGHRWYAATTGHGG